jgi:hypothetical protein
MSNEINPGHREVRAVLRVIGPATALVGLLFVVIGFGSFFASFGSFEPPRFFWCAFVGIPLLGVGVMISKFAYIGTVFRYMAGETAPVGKDVTNYMVAGTKDSIRDAATAVGEGFAVAGRGQDARAANCPQCGAENDESANFCHDCGAPITKAKRCEKCGEVNNPLARFCDNCGTPVA